MSIRGTIIMLILCLGLGCFWYIHDYKGEPERQEAKTQEERVLPGLQAKHVSKLHWSGEAAHPEQERNLVYDKGVWMLVLDNGLQFVADQTRAGETVTKVSEMARLSVILDKPESKDLAQFGLDKPQYQLEVSTDKSLSSAETDEAAAKVSVPEADKYSLSIGKATPGGDSYYAQVTPSSPVLEIKGDFMDFLKERALDMREMTALMISPEQVARISVTNGSDRSFTLSKVSSANDIVADKETTTAGAKWMLESPQQGRADQSAVNDYLWKLNAITVEKFLQPDEFASAGRARMTWAIKNDKGRDLVFDLCNGVPGKANTFYMKRHNPDEYLIVRFDDDVSKVDALTSADFIDRHMFEMSIDDINRLQVSIPANAVGTNHSEPLVLDARKIRDGWDVRQPNTAIRDENKRDTAVFEIAYSIVDMMWDEKLDKGGSKLEKGLPEVTVYGPKDEVLAHLYVGEKSADGRGYYLKVEGREEMYVVATNPSQTWIKSIRTISGIAEEKEPTPAAGNVPAASGDVTAPVKAGRQDGEAPIEAVKEPAPVSQEPKAPIDGVKEPAPVSQEPKAPIDGVKEPAPVGREPKAPIDGVKEPAPVGREPKAPIEAVKEPAPVGQEPKAPIDGVKEPAPVRQEPKVES